MTPEDYKEKLREEIASLESRKNDLERAIQWMERRIETGYENMEQRSRLAALSTADLVKISADNIRMLATSIIEY